MLILGALSLLLELFILYWVLRNNVSLPLATLATAVNRVAEGDLDIRLPHSRRDELGRISEAFESMAGKIEARTQDLIKSQNELELQVEQRTQALKDAQDSLIKKERLATLGQLTATVSHELRNPLAAILSSIYILKSDVDHHSDTYKRAVERIQRNTRRCDHIIDELLDFTRAGNPEPENIQPEDWLNATIEELDISEEITVEKLFEAGNATIRFDPNRMRRAVVNIITNASQAMLGQDRTDAAPPHLKIRTWRDDSGFHVSFTDNGCGMSADVQQHMFEPLYSTKGFGVGLGMSAIRQIMDQHHGSIEVTSEIGRGTTVTLNIPQTG